MSKNSTVSLVAPSVRFYSKHDENAFFEWLNKLQCLNKFEGVGPNLYLHINVDQVDEDDLRELLSLFRRYEIPMQQLIALDQKKFKTWFRNEKAYWYSAIFLSHENTQ